MQRIKASNLNRGLVGAWCPSVSGSGLLLPDLSGYGNHGTLTNMAANDWVGTDKGRALDFDGSDDYADCGNNTALNFTDNFTIAAWINRATSQVSPDSGIIGKISNVDSYQGYMLWYNGNTIDLYFAGANRANSTTTIVANTWYNVVGVYDGKTAFVYINGNLDVSSSVVALANAANSNFWIGRYLATGQGSRNFTGKISCAYAYNRALSASEIKQLYEGGPGYGLRQERKRTRYFIVKPKRGGRSPRKLDKGNLKQGLVGAWCPSVAGSGFTLPDLSGRGNHGTLTNMDASDWVGTDKGRALDFDGSNDVVRIDNWRPVRSEDSIAVFLKTSTSQTNSFFAGQTISTLNVPYRFLAMTTNNVARYFQSVGGSAAGTTPLNDGKWHLVVGTYKNDLGSVYVDGNLEGTANFTAESATLMDRFAIGRLDRQSPAAPWTGQLADIRIYNRALSPSEIKQLYEGGPGYGLKPERKRSRFVIQQQFNVGRFRRQQLIGSGVY